MSVVAKFQVNEIHDRLYGGKKVVMAPVYPAPEDAGTVTSKEDGQFFQATPQGELWMQVDNENAAEQFQVGDKFYLTFERAPEPEPQQINGG